MQYVIFGVDGYIGSYIFRQLEKENFNVLGTSRKSYDNNKTVCFDIRKDNIDHIMAKMYDKNKIAIICIAESNIDRCCENYNQAYEVNVFKTKELIHKLVSNGFRIIYFSSDNVFDGACGGYTEESLTCPVNQYGLMKEEMEHYLLMYEPKTCILRIPKVVGIHKTKQNILTQWMDQVTDGSIRCIRGNRMSFVYIDDIYQACLLVAARMMHGIYNIAGDAAYSRAELARKFFDKLDITKMKIRECSLEEFSFKDGRPLNLEMSNLKFKNETKYQFTTMDFVLDKYIESVIKKTYL